MVRYQVEMEMEILRDIHWESSHLDHYLKWGRLFCWKLRWDDWLFCGKLSKYLVFVVWRIIPWDISYLVQNVELR